MTTVHIKVKWNFSHTLETSIIMDSLDGIYLLGSFRFTKKAKVRTPKFEINILSGSHKNDKFGYEKICDGFLRETVIILNG